jgi:two-component system sensor histidine kinase DesK
MPASTGDIRHGRTVAGVSASVPAPPPSRAALTLARNVSATWWYTASSVVFFHFVVLALWALSSLAAPAALPRSAVVVLFLVGAPLSLAAAVGLLADYRRGSSDDEDDAPWPPSALTAWSLSGSLVAAAMLGVAAASWLLVVALLVYALCLLRWPPGIRWRVLVLSIIVLATLLWIENIGVRPRGDEDPLSPHPGFALLLPVITVLSLWWWDVVIELDRARAVESRLAAAQERLRLAGDLHDLQGHHLQVIALQLELAERMLERGADGAVEQVRAARRSVDEARRGTRELAARFRGVPLPDELANAADLLRAAGLQVELDVEPGADAAPSEVLGPVVRECTTNVLKHGGGRWARLSLRREAAAWRLEFANDPALGSSSVGAGAGLVGIAERVGAVGGELRSMAGEDRFDVVVTVPDSATAHFSAEGEAR